MLKYMLDAHEEDDVSVAADTETLVDNLLTILFAGYDTSSITLTYVHSSSNTRIVLNCLACLIP
jgi:cytochrome P450